MNSIGEEESFYIQNELLAYELCGHTKNINLVGVQTEILLLGDCRKEDQLKYLSEFLKKHQS